MLACDDDAPYHFQFDTMEEEHPSLPAEVLRRVATLLVANESPANAVLYLVRMCGVCSHWRSVACEVPVESIVFHGEGQDNALVGPLPSGQAVLPRFRKQPVAVKKLVFQGAAKLLTGAPAFS